MKDIVIGAVTKYNYDRIKYWVNSLESSGFSGEKYMICYNVSYEVCENLAKKGFKIFGFQKNDELRTLEYPKPIFNICVDRFLHIWYFLSKLQNKEQYRYVISTDVRDVIFQSNPSTWLETNIKDKKIVVGSESILMKNEEWNNRNLHIAFGPLIAESLQNSVVYNAGVVAGEFDTFIDFCKNVYLSSFGVPSANIQGGGGSDISPDQPAMNVLLNTVPYKNITKFASTRDGWVVHLAVMGDPKKEKVFKDYIMDPTFKVVDDTLYTHDGKKYCMVHQYDRNPEITSLIQKKYE